MEESPRADFGGLIHLVSQAFLNRPPQLLPHRQLVPLLDELGELAIFHAKEGAGRPAGPAASGSDITMRLALMASLRGVTQAHAVFAGEEHVEAEQAQIAD